MAGKNPIDWNNVRKRIESIGIAIEHGFRPTKTEKKKILRARAKRFAVESGKKKVSRDALEILEFILAQERYGIESAYIREVRHLKELTPIPGTPPFVLGIINLHGKILSVIDIKKIFDMPDTGITDLNKVIVITSDKMEFGILADSIVGICTIQVDDIQTSLPTLTGIRADYLKGVTGKRTVILDAIKLLSDKRIILNA